MTTRSKAVIWSYCLFFEAWAIPSSRNQTKTESWPARLAFFLSVDHSASFAVRAPRRIRFLEADSAFGPGFSFWLRFLATIDVRFVE